MKGRAIVIVGGDSVIGRQLSVECAASGVSVMASTRRTEGVGAGRFLLDLTAPRPDEYLPQTGGPVIIAAAMTGYDACQNDPLSAVVNVEAPVLLARAALGAGRRVIFLSTSSVFNGDLPFPGEDDELTPHAAYSMQKAEAERRLSALPGWLSNGAIVRLTKALSPSTSPIPGWRERLGRGETITPFSDLTFAPISLQFAVSALIQITLSAHCGIFHLSGAADVTYAQFARRYAQALGPGADIVEPTTSAQAGVKLLFNPRHSALGTARTQRLTGIAPQSLDGVVEDLLQAEQNANGHLF